MFQFQITIMQAWNDQKPQTMQVKARGFYAAVEHVFNTTTILQAWSIEVRTNKEIPGHPGERRITYYDVKRGPFGGFIYNNSQTFVRSPLQ